MTKFKTNSIIYTLSLILLVGVLAFSVALTCVRSTQNAYADYESDIINNPQAIVNFNQLFNNTISRGNYNTIAISKNNVTYSVNGYFTGYSLNLAFNETAPSINLYANHKYYLDFKLNVNSGSTPNLLVFNSNGSYLNSGNNAQIMRPSVDIVVSIGFHVLPAQNSSSNPYDFNVTPMLIDLTQMFGVGSEPDISECRDLFKADYYTYNLGSAIMFNSLDSYSQGYNDAFKSYTFTSNSYDLYTNSFSYNATYFKPNDSNTSLGFNGIVGFNVGFTLEPGNVCNVKDMLFLPYSTSTLVFQIGYLNGTAFVPLVDDINNYITGYVGSIVSLPSASFTFVMPVRTDTLYLRCINSADTTTAAIRVSTFSIEFEIFDFQQALKTNYESGYNKAQNYYSSYYSEGGSGYQTIYDLAYNRGINASATDFANTYYTFPQFLGALFDVPVSVLTSLLDFDVFGFNLKNLVFSLITLAIVFAIIRLILMKTGDK